MMENPHYITKVTPDLIFVAKNIERAGDHLPKIAELIYYAVYTRSGKHPMIDLKVTKAAQLMLNLSAQVRAIYKNWYCCYCKKCLK